eukprot:10391-Eustigmatos_ZCMA.PRE.1
MSTVYCQSQVSVASARNSRLPLLQSTVSPVASDLQVIPTLVRTFYSSYRSVSVINRSEL